MERTIECRDCHKVGKAIQDQAGDWNLPEGWHYTKRLDSELDQPRGKPTCPDCIVPDIYLLDARRKLYDD